MSQNSCIYWIGCLSLKGHITHPNGTDNLDTPPSLNACLWTAGTEGNHLEGSELSQVNLGLATMIPAELYSFTEKLL